MHRLWRNCVGKAKDRGHEEAADALPSAASLCLRSAAKKRKRSQVACLAVCYNDCRAMEGRTGECANGCAGCRNKRKSHREHIDMCVSAMVKYCQFQQRGLLHEREGQKVLRRRSSAWERLEKHPFEFRLTSWMLEKHIKPGDRVLDVGGGPGRYAIHFAKMGCEGGNRMLD